MKSFTLLLIFSTVGLVSTSPIAEKDLEKKNPTLQQPFENAPRGVGKVLDSVLDETLDPVLDAEEDVVDAVADPIYARAHPALQERGLSGYGPNENEPSPTIKTAIHDLALAIRAEQDSSHERGIEKRDLFDDILLIIGTLEPIVVPLTGA